MATLRVLLGFFLTVSLEASLTNLSALVLPS